MKETNNKPKKKAAAPKKNVRKTVKSTKSNGKSKEIVSICLAAVSIILFVCVYAKQGGALGRWISTAAKGFFGVGAYVIPVVVLASVVHFFVSDSDEKKKNYILSI